MGPADTQNVRHIVVYEIADRLGVLDWDFPLPEYISNAHSYSLPPEARIRAVFEADLRQIKFLNEVNPNAQSR